MTTDMRPQLHEIKAPVTILYPWDASKGISQAAGDKLYRENYAALPNKTFVRIDDSYHFIMLDQPDAFADPSGRVPQVTGATRRNASTDEC